MSTLDVVNQVGGSAANFLDMRRRRHADVMASALEVSTTRSEGEGDLRHIFGGTLESNDVANGV